MSVSISDSSKTANVTLTWNSAACYEWNESKGSPWLYRVVKSGLAFLIHVDMNKKELDKWFTTHTCDTLKVDYDRALNDRKVRIADRRELRKNQKKQTKAMRIHKRQTRLNPSAGQPTPPVGQPNPPGSGGSG